MEIESRILNNINEESIIKQNLKFFLNKENLKLKESDAKFLIDATIVGLFGILEASKIKYSLTQSKENADLFCLKAFKKLKL